MEQQILSLHNQGLNYSQIATQLGCSRATVRYHVDPKAKESVKNRITLRRAKKKKSKVKKEKEKPKVIPVPVIKEVKVRAIPKIKHLKKDKPSKEVRVFKNKDLKLNEKTLVRLDSKTQVYANPGYSLENLKNKYLKK